MIPTAGSGSVMKGELPSGEELAFGAEGSMGAERYGALLLKRTCVEAGVKNIDK
jgi:hypothetical protein